MTTSRCRRDLPFILGLEGEHGHVRDSVSGCLQSNEIPGTGPLLLSGDAQASLGMIKNMAECTCVLTSHPGLTLPLHKCSRSGLWMVDIGNFPSVGDRTCQLSKSL